MREPSSGPELTPQDIRFVQPLRQHPEMLARMQSILELTRAAGGPLLTADEVEELLIQELRQLGNTTMNRGRRRQRSV